MEFQPVVVTQRGIFENSRAHDPNDCVVCLREIDEQDRRRQCPLCDEWLHAHHYKCHVGSCEGVGCCRDEVGVFSNVSSFLQTLRYETRKECKRHDSSWEASSYEAPSILSGMSYALNSVGVAVTHPEKSYPGRTTLQDNRLCQFWCKCCLLYTSPSPRDGLLSRMPSSA